jgi:4-amino-4-deoxy-L-arabinose transferase-like glycosyltransferase
VVYTVTQIVHNPTGALDSGGSSGGSTSSFFNNKGAVAGVFVVVGLVVVGMIMALGLLCFRRRRRQRLDREVIAAAIAASAAHQRTPLDEDNDVPSSTHQTSESYPSTVNQPMQQYNQYGASYSNGGGYDTYASVAAGHPYEGYGAAAGAGAAGAAGAAGYESLQHGQQGYYFDPNTAAQYTDDPHSYPDPYAGYQDEGTGSIDTPPERENPLHVSAAFGVRVQRCQRVCDGYWGDASQR